MKIESQRIIDLALTFDDVLLEIFLMEKSYNQHVPHLPKHLLQYVVDQEYDQYTPVDHSVWRYVMRQNLDYLPKGTKVKPFTSKEGKKGGSYWDKWIRYFNKKIFDEPFFDVISKKK